MFKLDTDAVAYVQKICDEISQSQTKFTKFRLQMFFLLMATLFFMSARITSVMLTKDHVPGQVAFAGVLAIIAGSFSCWKITELEGIEKEFLQGNMVREDRFWSSRSVRIGTMILTPILVADSIAAFPWVTAVLEAFALLFAIFWLYVTACSPKLPLNHRFHEDSRIE